MNKLRGDYEEFIYVNDSQVHGKGIFTSVDIPKDSLVFVIRGEVIDEEECMRREDEENNVYIFWNEINYIDTANTNKIKFINHDCNPNCEVDDGDELSLNLYAIRDIKAGEEITMDYDYEEIFEDCNCATCMGKKRTEKPEYHATVGF